MTKKRFLVIYDGFGEDSDVLIREDIDEWKYTLIPIYEKGEYNKAGIDEIINRLNELYKENEQLKKQLECSREEANDYCEELMGKDEFIRLYKRQRDDALKENKELKSDNNRLVNETAKIVAEHQGRVLDLIDENIEELEGQYKFGQEVYRGCPMHNIGFGINTLKELKKELIE